MDELDDLADFGLAEVDADRAAGEYADPHAPAAGEALTMAQVVALAAFILGDDSVGDTVAKEVARRCLAAAPVVAAAEDQLDAADVANAIPNIEPTEDGEWLDATEHTEAVTRAYRAAGGDA